MTKRQRHAGAADGAAKQTTNIPALEANVSWHAAVDRNTLPPSTHPDSFNPLLEFFSFFFFPHYSRHTMITSILFVAACPWNHARRITCEPGFSLQSRGARGVELTLPLLHRAVCLLSVGNVVFSGCCVSEMHRIWHGAYLGPNW